MQKRPIRITKKNLRRRQKRQLALLTMIVLIASIAAIMLLTPVFDINEVEVRGNMVLKNDEIISLSGIEKGANTFSVDLDDIENNIIEMESRVAKVKVRRSLPSKIIITVEEEVGVAYLVAEKGFVILAADGKCIEVTDGTMSSGEGKKVTSAPKLPKIVGMNNVKYKVGSTITSENENQLEALLLCLHEFTKHGYVFDMTEIDVSDTSEIRFYYKSKKLCANIGKAVDMESKMVRFGPIYEYVVSKTKEGEMPSGYINLKRYDKATYSLTEDSPKKTDEIPEKTQ